MTAAQLLEGLAFEIRYQKVSEDVGLFFVDLTLPAALRQLQLGAASLTLPSLSVWVYTNGDFKVSIGWPLGERSITVQMFPFIGGGEEGDKQRVRTKEEADHSLPYMVAVALLDGDVSPAQYVPERIVREDVQSLLRRVTIQPDEELSKRFPAEMPCRIQITLKDGRAFAIEKQDYEGFYTRPMSWEKAVAKFERLAAPYTDAAQREAIVETVAHLETKEVVQLTQSLGASFARTH